MKTKGDINRELENLKHSIRVIIKTSNLDCLEKLNKIYNQLNK